MDRQVYNRHAKWLRQYVIATACVVGVFLVIALGLYGRSQEIRLKRAKEEVERRSRFFDIVKAGDDGGEIYISDPQIIEMLASDADCIANFRWFNILCEDLSGEGVLSAAKLKNVKYIYFYGCKNPEHLLSSMQGLPSVKSIHFNDSQIPEPADKLLGSFPNLKDVSIVNETVRPDLEKELSESLPGVHIDIADFSTLKKDE